MFAQVIVCLLAGVSVYMEVKRCKNKETEIVRLLFLLISLVCLFFVAGCSSKSVVTFPASDTSQNSVLEQMLQVDKMEIAEATETELVEAKRIRLKARTETLKKHYDNWKGTRYRYGGLSHKGIDCSGFALLTYKKLFRKNLPRTVREQVKQGKTIPKSSLEPGDLVFFKTGVVQKHVGIYLEDDFFMHASRSHGVMISRLDDDYWEERFWQAKRINVGSHF